MNRPLLGLIVGAVVGFLDGGTAKWTSPEPEYQAILMSIMLGSAFKGLIGGLLTGFFARKTGSLAKGIAIGVSIAVVLAAIIAYMNAQEYADNRMYWRIIGPGAITGLVVGYAIVRYGKPAGGQVAT